VARKRFELGEEKFERTPLHGCRMDRDDRLAEAAFELMGSSACNSMSAAVMR
jgi:hypothetical protein